MVHKRVVRQLGVATLCVLICGCSMSLQPTQAEKQRLVGNMSGNCEVQSASPTRLTFVSGAAIGMYRPLFWISPYGGKGSYSISPPSPGTSLRLITGGDKGLDARSGRITVEQIAAESVSGTLSVSELRDAEGGPESATLDGTWVCQLRTPSPPPPVQPAPVAPG